MTATVSRFRQYAPGAVRLRLGEILVEAGDVSASQLAAALDAKRTSGRRIGEELLAAGCLRRDRLAAALKLQRRLAVLAFAAALIPMNREVHAEQARAQMRVSATVVDAVGVGSVHQAQRLVITAEDVRRGYVDVPAATRVDLRCSRFCLFEMKPTQDFVRSVRVTGLDTAAEFGPGGGTLLHKATAQAPQVAMDYRFTLAPHVAPGAYPWPVALSVMPM
ncbi:MAG TPA: hypothetical protein VHP37_15570 [Burkholderiales bacterium]|nr:hypothetical protein [Burkholderiales bacterium]